MSQYVEMCILPVETNSASEIFIFIPAELTLWNRLLLETMQTLFQESIGP
jgi:hypothetical protein